MSAIPSPVAMAAPAVTLLMDTFAHVLLTTQMTSVCPTRMNACLILASMVGDAKMV